MFHIPEIDITGFEDLKEIQNNLELLYSTTAGTCPGDRNFGLDQSFLSCPMNVAQNLFALEIIEKTEMYEDRAEILDITYTQAADGNLTPKVVIGRKEQDDTEEDADAEASEE